MQAVILAGGLGKRLRPITETVPKALVPVRGRPIIIHILDELPVEITEIIIVTGYLGEQIESTIGQSYNGRRVIYTKQEKQRGTFDALRTAQAHLRDRFLVLNADDLVTKDDIHKLLDEDLSMLVVDHQLENPFGVCELDQDDYVTSVVEKPIYKSIINTGSYVLDTKIFDIKLSVGPKGEYVLATAIGEQIKKGAKIKAIHATSYKTLTAPEDLTLIEQSA